MEDRLKLLIRELGEMRVKLDIDASEYLETKLGCKVPAFYLATTTSELVSAVEVCRELDLPFFLIGSGSKVSLKNSGFAGVLIKNRSHAMKVSGIKGKVSPTGIGIEEAFIEADSGVTLGSLIEFADAQGLGGIEYFQSLSGTIGGNLFINPDLRTIMHQIKVLTPLGDKVTKSSDELKKEDIILSVVFKLKAKNPPK